MTVVRPLDISNTLYLLVENTPELKIIFSFITYISYYLKVAYFFWIPKLQQGYLLINWALTQIAEAFFAVVARLPSRTQLLQYLWLVSHMTSILSAVTTFLYTIDFDDSTNYKRDVWYTIGGTSTIVTYLIVIFNSLSIAFNSNSSQRNKQALSIQSILKPENFHLLGMAIVSATSSTNFVKAIPFLVYSMLNIVEYLSLDLFPDSTFFFALSKFLLLFENHLLQAAATVEYLILVVYAKESILQKSSPYIIPIYAILCILKMQTSFENRQALCTILRSIDMILVKVNKKLSISYIVQTSETILLSTEFQISTIPIPPSSHFMSKRKERVASFAFDRYTVVNDLHLE